MRLWLLTFLAFIGFVSIVVTESEPEPGPGPEPEPEPEPEPYPKPDPELYKRCQNSETGERYREAETWTEEESCAECMCMKSGPECYDIECVEPVCVQEGHRIGTLPGKCCPGCIGQCIDNKGKEYGDGESWSPDPCTHCTCTVNEETGDKNQMCAVTGCAYPADCHTKPITPPDQCCPICPRKCVDDSGEEYGDGESWSPDPCTFCTCAVINKETGEKEEMCATADCFYPSECPYDFITPPDQCCPICPCTNPKTGETHKIGDSFKADPCTDCVCTETGAQCNMIMCDVPYCRGIGDGWREWLKPGSCCPGCVGPCTDNKGKEHEIGDSWKRDACTDCECEDDGKGGKRESCSAEDCPDWNCKTEIVKIPDQCCPVCRKPCTDPETSEVYEEGSVWSPAKCKQCSCERDEDGVLEEVCKDSCGTNPVECQRFVAFGKDFICLDDKPNCAVVKCAAPKCPNYITFADQCCPSCIPEDCALVDCAMEPDCEAVYISKSPCCPVCVITAPAPEPTPPDLCALVGVCAEPECDNPIYFGHDQCCPMWHCLPDHCQMVDCMPVHPNCESVYTSKEACCPVCKDPPQCPEGEAMAECFYDPCSTAKCSNYPNAKCKASFCGECTAIFYDANGDIISNCKGDCLTGQIFKECGMACTPTCSDPLPACTRNCVRRCQCPASAPILYKQSCMPANECPNYLPFCDEIYSDGDSDDKVSQGSGTSDSSGSSSSSSSSNRESRSVQQAEIETPGCEQPAECPEDLCETTKCPNFPNAKCRMDDCDKCQAVFYHETGYRIKNCEGECPRSMKYNDCGSACTATCSNPNPVCIEMCVSRCECPRETPILIMDECTPSNECSDSDGDSDSVDGDSDGNSGGSGDGGPCRPRYPEPMPPIRPECDNIVNCLVNPCEVQSCPNYPLARCKANYCGGCNADFYDSSGAVMSDCEGECNAPKEYTECGSACPQTCFTDPSSGCIALCVPGCSCPSSAPVLYRGKCITRDQCPARMDQDNSGSGAVFNDDSAESGNIWDSLVRDSSSSVFSIALTLSLLTVVRLVFF